MYVRRVDELDKAASYSQWQKDRTYKQHTDQTLIVKIEIKIIEVGNKGNSLTIILNSQI
jgi:hypothetical protein